MGAATNSSGCLQKVADLIATPSRNARRIVRRFSAAVSAWDYDLLWPLHACGLLESSPQPERCRAVEVEDEAQIMRSVRNEGA